MPKSANVDEMHYTHASVIGVHLNISECFFLSLKELCASPKNMCFEIK